MSLTTLTNASASRAAAQASTQAGRADASTTGVGATLASVAAAASDGVSATASFSGQALHALEHAGEAVLGGAEDLAVGAWHVAKSVAAEVGHYAEVALETTGDAVSDVASSAVFVAAAGGKALRALI
jgi:hypothetical protein